MAAKGDIGLDVFATRPSLRKLQRELKRSTETVEIKGLSDSEVRKKFKQPLGRIKGDLGEFQKSMDASNARVIAFGASVAIINGVASAFKGAAKASVEVESALADINVILNTTTKGLQKFGSELFEIARNTGQSFKVVAEAAGELARQGLGMEDTLKRTSDALILARLSGMDTVDAVNSLTAAVNSFSKSALTSAEIVNKLANVDAAFAVSSADLAEAIKRVGSSASSAGVSMDELIAIVTTAQQTTARGGAVIGNSFKTIFTRLQRPKVLDQLEGIGVATKNAAGEMLPLMSVLKGLAGSFDKLEDTQRAQIAELVGGVFQVNILKAALSDLGQEYGVYGRALETSITSTDQAILRNEKLNETLSSLINRTLVNVQRIGAEIGDLGMAPTGRMLLEGINKNPIFGIEDFDLKEADGVGEKLGAGIVRGLGAFMKGPGLILAGAGFLKLFGKLRTFALDAFKGISGLNVESNKRKAIEERIGVVLADNNRLMRNFTEGTITATKAAEELLRAMASRDVQTSRKSSLIRQTARQMSDSFNIDDGMVTVKGTKRRSKAFGYVPNFNKQAGERLEMLMAGYNPSDIKSARITQTRIHKGDGTSFLGTMNSAEKKRTTTNAYGHKATWIIPPKSSSAYGRFTDNVPNFAGPRAFEKLDTPTGVYWSMMLKKYEQQLDLSKPDSVIGAQMQKLIQEEKNLDWRVEPNPKKRAIKKKKWAKEEKKLPGMKSGFQGTQLGQSFKRMKAREKSGEAYKTTGSIQEQILGMLPGPEGMKAGSRRKKPLAISSGRHEGAPKDIIGGLATQYRAPLHPGKLDRAVKIGFPSYVKKVAFTKGVWHQALNQTEKDILSTSLNKAAGDEAAMGQVYGRVYEAIIEGMTMTRKKKGKFGSAALDYPAGTEMKEAFHRHFDPEFLTRVKAEGGEHKSGEFEWDRYQKKQGGIWGKMLTDPGYRKGGKTPERITLPPEGEALLNELVASGQVREKTFYKGLKAGGFVPNFSKKTAMDAERKMGGDPMYSDLPFPHVRDKKTQKRFSDVLRDHPEGLGAAISNSLSVQKNIPSFAPPMGSGIGKLLKGLGINVMGDVLGGAKREIKESKYGKKVLGTKSLEAEIADLEEEFEGFVKSLTRHNKEIIKASLNLQKFEAKTFGVKGVSKMGTIPEFGDRTDRSFLDKEREKAAFSSEAAKITADKKRLDLAADKLAHRRRADKAEVMADTILAKKEELQARPQGAVGSRMEKIKGGLFAASFAVPTATGIISEFMGRDSSMGKGATILGESFSAAAGVASILPGHLGLIAGAAVGLGSAIGKFTNAALEVGKELGRTKEELQQSLQNLQDASTRYFDIASKLDDAVKSGASGDLITRLGEKLQDTLAKLDPATQAIVTSSFTLAEKQDALGKIIEGQGKELKQIQLAENLAKMMNEARGSGFVAFFKMLGGMAPGGLSPTEAGRNFEALDSRSVGGAASALFGSLGAKKVRTNLGVISGAGDKDTLAGVLEDSLGATSDLAQMVRLLTEEDFEALRLKLMMLGEEAQRNADLAEVNIETQKRYNAIMTEANKGLKIASGNLLDMQKRLIETFVFNREMRSKRFFNEIDITIAKFDKLFGIASSTMGSLQKADANFRKKRFNADVGFQKKIISAQNTFVGSMTDVSGETARIVKGKNQKAKMLNRTRDQVNFSQQIISLLEQFDLNQDPELLKKSLKDAVKNDSTALEQERMLINIDKNFNTFLQQSTKAQIEREKQTKLNQAILDIDREQARLMAAGGIKSVLDPASFDTLIDKFTDASRDMLVGGGFTGQGVNSTMAGSGALNMLKLLRENGMIGAGAGTIPPNLRKQAVDARIAQINELTEGLIFLGQRTGNPSMVREAQNINAREIAEANIAAFEDPMAASEKQITRISELMKDLKIDFNSHESSIEDILNANVKSNRESFLTLDKSSAQLLAASEVLLQFQIAREFDTAAEHAQIRLSDKQYNQAVNNLTKDTDRLREGFQGMAEFEGPDGGSKDRRDARAAFSRAMGYQAFDPHNFYQTSKLGTGWSGPGEMSMQKLGQDFFKDKDVLDALKAVSGLPGGLKMGNLTTGGRTEMDEFNKNMSILAHEIAIRKGLDDSREIEVGLKEAIFGREIETNMLHALSESTDAMSSVIKTSIQDIIDAGHLKGTSERELKVKGKERREAEDERVSRTSQATGFGITDEDEHRRNLQEQTINVLKASGETMQAMRRSQGEFKASLKEVFTVETPIGTAIQDFVAAVKDPLDIKIGEHTITVRGDEQAREELKEHLSAAVKEAAREAVTSVDSVYGRALERMLPQALNVIINQLPAGVRGSTTNAVNAVIIGPN